MTIPRPQIQHTNSCSRLPIPSQPQLQQITPNNLLIQKLHDLILRRRVVEPDRANIRGVERVVTDFEIVEVIPAMRRYFISLNVGGIDVRLLGRRFVWEIGIGKGKGKKM